MTTTKSKTPESSCGCTLDHGCGIVKWMEDKIGAIQRSAHNCTPVKSCLLRMIWYAHRMKALKELATPTYINAVFFGPMKARIKYAYEEFTDWRKVAEGCRPCLPGERNCSIMIQCTCGHWNNSARQFCKNCSRIVPAPNSYMWETLALLREEKEKRERKEKHA